MGERVHECQTMGLSLTWGDDSDWWHLTDKPDGFVRLPNSASIEGSRAEFLDLARAVIARGAESHKRCAVRTTSTHADFWSPRNSCGDVSRVPISVADAWARALLAEPEWTPAPRDEGHWCDDGEDDQ